MSRRAPAECRARAGGGDAPSRRERTAPVELRSLDLLNGVRRQPLGYNKPTVQAPHIQPITNYQMAPSKRGAGGGSATHKEPT